jgi:pimeloyl-ACP methyl ester carboxylesterase
MRKIELKNLQINYECIGNGPDVILLHGWGQNIESFRPTIDFLHHNFRVWTIDLPGFGRSQEPFHGLNIYEYENILSEFIKQNNIKNPTLVGHSFGGRIAIIYASRNNNINKLVLTGAAGIKPKRSVVYRYKVWHYKFMKFLCKTPFYYQFKNDLLSTSGSSDYKNASLVMKETLIKVVNEDLTYLLQQIETDTLLYWGENDDATPLKDGQLMNRLIANSELITIENAGHYAYLENNVDFNKKLFTFLA